jgi:hypothetical protein
MVFSLRRYYPHQVLGVAPHAAAGASQLFPELLRKLLLAVILQQFRRPLHLAPILRRNISTVFFELHPYT